MYFNNLEYLLSILYPRLTWRRQTKEKILYLSFDDGPIPEVTEYVLSELKAFGAKATFFCVGDNIAKHPSELQKILTAGHKIGNHTFNHFNGWKYDYDSYIDNVRKCDNTMQDACGATFLNHSTSSISGKKLFRPPYGKIKKSQIRELTKEYEIVMWDVLTGDFDKNLSPEKCLHKAIKYTRNGSIIIFHDSVKALPNLKYALPRFLKHFTEAGFRFETL